MNKKNFFSACLITSLIALFLLPLSITAGTMSAMPGSLQGRVIDATTQSPLPGALVTVFKAMSQKGTHGFLALTNQEGYYTINGIAPGNYFVTADADGYIKSKQMVKVNPGNSLTVNFSLNPGGTLTGTVTDAETLLPIEGAMIFMRPERSGMGEGGDHGDGQQGYYAVTDSEGHYTIEDVEPGDYLAQAKAQGYDRDEQAVTITEGETTTADFSLNPLPVGTLTGTVTDAETFLPIEGAMVFLRHSSNIGGCDDGGHGGGHHGFFAVTDENGDYTIEFILAGNYVAMATARGYENSEQDVAITEGETTTADFALDPLSVGTLAGTVTDAETGAPIGGAMVSLCGGQDDGGGCGLNGGGHHGFSAVTDENGQYLIEGIPAGVYTAHARAQDYTPASSEVEILEDQTTTADFSLDPLVTGTLTGTVTDADTGSALEGVVVMVFCWDGDGEGGDDPWRCDGGGHGGGNDTCMDITGPDGIYTIENIPVGTHQVIAMKCGYQRAMETAEILENQVTTLDLSLQPW